MMLKVEIDATKEAQVAPATQFVRKHKCPALVVPPDLYRSATVCRALSRGSHKIISTVDWPKGTQFLSDKFRGMASDAVHADGFEILLTPGRTLGIAKEVKFLVAFFRDHFAQTVELRFVLGWHAPGRTIEQFRDMVASFKQIPTPMLVRTTHLTKIPSVDGTVEAHQLVVDEIQDIKKVPIKLSGNINMAIRRGVKNVHRFGCTLQQAIDLQKSLAGVIEGIEEGIEGAVGVGASHGIAAPGPEGS